jgi:DNA-directed RNA polymerase subunit RPC12/RpoP
MPMKNDSGNSLSDDVEFDDLDDFDYVDQFISKDEEDGDFPSDGEDYDDLDDLYVEESEEAEDMDEELSEEENEFIDDDISDMDEELEARFICEECGHKWQDFVSETEEENDLLEVNCPMCGSSNITMEG